MRNNYKVNVEEELLWDMIEDAEYQSDMYGASVNEYVNYYNSTKNYMYDAFLHINYNPNEEFKKVRDMMTCSTEFAEFDYETGEQFICKYI